jgi:hypothetical protein
MTEEQVPTSADQLSGLIEHMHMAGERLIAALAHEERVAAFACKFPDDAQLYNEWARARQAVEECQAAYCDAVTCINFSATDPIREALETA